MRLDRYLLSEWLKIFSLCIGLVVAVLVLQEVYNDLPDFLEAEASLGVVVRYFATLVPGFIPTLVPLGMLVAVIFTVGTFHRTSELTAIRAAGIGLLRFSLPLWIAGGVLGILLVWLGGEIVPLMEESARAQKEALREVSARPGDVGSGTVIRNAAVALPGAGRLWYFNQLDPATGEAVGVSVHLLGPGHREETRLLADRATWEASAGVWRLYQGRELVRDADGIAIRAEVPFRERVIGADGVSPRVMASLQDKPQDLSLFRLREVVDAFRAGDASYVRPFQVAYHRKLVEPMACLVAVAFGVPFAAAGVRRNPFVSTARAIGAFLIYLIGGRVIGLAGARGWLDPALAAWLPPVIALTFGLWLFLRGR